MYTVIVFVSFQSLLPCTLGALRIILMPTFWMVSILYSSSLVNWPVDWNWSGPRTSPHVKVSLVSVCGWCGQTEEPWGGCKNFILAKGLKIEFLGIITRKQFNLVHTFYESCVHFDSVTHSSIHMTQKFMIQGCPTLVHLSNKNSNLTCNKYKHK